MSLTVSVPKGDFLLGNGLGGLKMMGLMVTVRKCAYCLGAEGDMAGDLLLVMYE